MFGNYYEGSVPMKPEMEMKSFISEDDLSYQMPKMYFECAGQVYDAQSAFAWSDDSLIALKDNCIVKYTASKFYEVLVTDADGKKHWLANRMADICGFGEGDVEKTIERKRYTVEEYDLEKSEKRTYSVILKTTVEMNDKEVQHLMDKLKAHSISESVLIDN